MLFKTVNADAHFEIADARLVNSCLLRTKCNKTTLPNGTIIRKNGLRCNVCGYRMKLFSNLL